MSKSPEAKKRRRERRAADRAAIAAVSHVPMQAQSGTPITPRHGIGIAIAFAVAGLQLVLPPNYIGAGVFWFGALAVLVISYYDRLASMKGSTVAVTSLCIGASFLAGSLLIPKKPPTVQTDRPELVPSINSIHIFGLDKGNGPVECMVSMTVLNRGIPSIARLYKATLSLKSISSAHEVSQSVETAPILPPADSETQAMFDRLGINERTLLQVETAQRIPELQSEIGWLRFIFDKMRFAQVCSKDVISTLDVSLEDGLGVPSHATYSKEGGCDPIPSDYQLWCPGAGSAK